VTNTNTDHTTFRHLWHSLSESFLRPYFPWADLKQEHIFNGLFSRTIWISQHQKDKLTILDFNEAQGDRLAVASAGPYSNHLHHAPHR